MKKIIHLSDLHVGYKDLGTRLGDLVTRIIFHKTPAKDYVVVVTGDVVEDATRDGSYAEASVHLDRLKESGFRVLPIPGNHDLGPGVFGDRKYVKLFKKHFFGTSDIEYPKLDVIENTAFIGLDSMAEEVNWWDRIFAEGELGKKQLQRLRGLLASDEVKRSEYRVVYLHHHPFDPKPFHHLKDSDGLQKAIKGLLVDCLLYGHMHEGLVWNGAWGIRRVYDGGTSTGKDGKANPHRVIDLSKDPAFDYDARF